MKEHRGITSRSAGVADQLSDAWIVSSARVAGCEGQGTLVGHGASPGRWYRTGSVILWLEQVRTGESLIGKGAPKVISNLLKQVGYLEEAPVDLHVKRFVKRVTRVDLSGDSRREGVLKELCSKQLTGLRYHDYDLGVSPGVLDKLIRIHCSPGRDEFGVPYRGICGDSPHCDVCPARSSCPKYV